MNLNSLIQTGGGISKLVENSNIIDKIETTDKKIYSIVLTGGPSAGKSTILQLVKKYFNRYNYDKDRSQQILILTLNEVATHLINQGISFTPLEPSLFQKLVLSNQISMENIIYEYAEALAKYYDKVVILLDRGLLDGKAYLIQTELNQEVETNWNSILDKINMKEQFTQHMEKYDLVIHIVTGAEGTGFFYTTENNAARTETAEQAIDIDKKTLLVWEKGISKPIYVIDNREGIVCREGKGIQIIKMISQIIQRKYVSIFTELSEPKPVMAGGYLKYKTKYIMLKKQLVNK